jgi:hypothetical protein
MCGRPQDLLGHRTGQVIEAKDRVRIDHSMVIRVGTADPVVDEIRFRASFRCFIILMAYLKGWNEC